MAKSWRAKHPDKIHPEPKPKLRKDIGDGYYILYKEVANGWGGYHHVEMELFNDQDQLVKLLTDRYGRFCDFPGTLPGNWEEKLSMGWEERVQFVCRIGTFKYGLAKMTWMVQPDGRYFADEDGFGAEPDEEILLVSYFNKKGEFVVPFADINVKYNWETLEEYERETNKFIWDSLPQSGDFYPNYDVHLKVERDGKLKPFYGNTVVFPLKEAALKYVENLQTRLYDCGEVFLSEKLDPATMHITLHDLVHSTTFDFIRMRVQVSGQQALYIVKKLREMDFPKIRLESTCMFNMNGTSMVLGFKPASQEDCENLMVIYNLFQGIVELGYPLRAHATLGYFKLGENGKYSADEIAAVRNLIEEHKQEEKLVVELDVKDLVYQEFSNMNEYVTVEQKNLQW